MPAFLPPLQIQALRSRSKRNISLRCPSRSAVCAVATPPPLIVGLNVYSHDTSVAILDARTGHILHALAKERISRRKHDAGDAASVIENAFQTLSATLNTPIAALAKSVTLVVANNHHFRIAPYESRLPLQVALHYAPPSSLSPWNLIGSPHASHKLAPNAHKIELSHHLAHAFSAISSAPFNEGLVVVMDGMGDALHDWQTSKSDKTHFSDCEVCDDAHNFIQWPVDLQARTGVSFREAESVYIFNKSNGIKLTRVFKRWTPENAPSELPNHSFEEMESVGAMYSRISAILFRDWNACGKVMGLAPYASKRYESREGNDRYFIKGHLYDGTLDVKGGQQKGLSHVNVSMRDPNISAETRQYFESLAYHIQKDLENVVLSFMQTLQQKTGQKNLVFVGGVALNSTLNGVLSSSKIFDHVFVPPWPGDDGISIGCAAFGYEHLQSKRGSGKPDLFQSTLPMPYFGKEFTKTEIMDAIKQFEPWITLENTNESQAAANALYRSEVVAWFGGRSEFGPRALGNRSILADPRPKEVVDHVNKVVKKREHFRPFAPSVLSEHASTWFKDCQQNTSPFMSMTLSSLRPSEVEAVVHVDGTSRLQTLQREQNPKYYELISLFYKLSGVPMVLNTSFNVAGEPIVDSPQDALKAFLDTDGIHMLAFPGIVIRKNEAISFSAVDVVSCTCSPFRSHQVQDSFGSNVRTEVTYIPHRYASLAGNLTERTVELIDGLALEILEYIHEQGQCIVSNIYDSFVIEGNPDEDALSEQNVASGDIHDRLIDLYRKRLIFRTEATPNFSAAVHTSTLVEG